MSQDYQLIEHFIFMRKNKQEGAIVGHSSLDTHPHPPYLSNRLDNIKFNLIEIELIHQYSFVLLAFMRA
jgi:hypothetical protein